MGPLLVTFVCDLDWRLVSVSLLWYLLCVLLLCRVTASLLWLVLEGVAVVLRQPSIVEFCCHYAIILAGNSPDFQCCVGNRSAEILLDCSFVLWYLLSLWLVGRSVRTGLYRLVLVVAFIILIRR